MLSVTSLVLTYLKTGSLYLLTASFPYPLPLVTTNLIYFSIVCLFLKYN